jgi:hypothetical protein
MPLDLNRPVTRDLMLVSKFMKTNIYIYIDNIKKTIYNNIMYLQ